MGESSTRLPSTAAAAQPPASQLVAGPNAPAAPVAAASFSILVVDDDEANRHVLRRRLDRHGYRVSTAADGLEALAAIEGGGRFDLVLLDVMMPGMSGMDVLARIRASRGPAELPIIMATARDASADIVAALEQGANDYVTKPLDFPVVLARVRTHLALKRSIEQVLELELSLSQQNERLAEANRQLLLDADRKRRDLEAAARVQEAFLPVAAPTMPGVRFAWAFEPCEELAGDSLNLVVLDPDHVALFVLDVSGHGVAASLLAVTATRLLSITGASDSIITAVGPEGPRPIDPADVARRLNERLPWNAQTEQFLTLFYAVLDVRTRALTYVSAGHPGAIRVGAQSPPSVLEGSNMPIGVGDAFEQQSVRLDPGDRVYLYTDGITEAMTPDRQPFGVGRLLDVLRAGRTQVLDGSVRSVLDEVARWGQGAPARDDMSLLALECT